MPNTIRPASGPTGARASGKQRILSSGEGTIRPRARLIRTLGAELISSEIVAVLELIRNSYDADATRVEIRFSDPHRPSEASLEIRDDGHGMPREILLGPWLEPATAHKSRRNGNLPLGGERSPGGRRRLGSKGVGRFATQRLGRHLVVRTRTGEERGGPSELEAEFDWDHLDQADRYLDEIVVPWREVIAADPTWNGTSLQVTRLRDGWTESRFERLRLGLSRLIGPGLGVDRFDIVLNVNGTEEKILPAIDSITAMYSIEGEIVAGGCKAIYRDISGTEELWERSVSWRADSKAACGPFQFRINAWDLDRDALEFFFENTGTSYGLREFRGIVRDHSGISLYRDAFRILPYGEPDNDWLRLDRRRVNNPTLRLSNNQILGRLSLTADGNPQLRDQTNREGLVSNESCNHLREVVLELLSYLEVRRFSSRRALDLKAGSGTNKLSTIQSESDDEIEKLLLAIECEGSGNNGQHVRNLRHTLDNQRQAIAEGIRQYTDLATTGQLASLVFSQLQHPVDQLRTEIAGLRDELEDAAGDGNLFSELKAGIRRMDAGLDDMVSRVRKVQHLGVMEKSRRLNRIDLVECIEEVGEIFLERLLRDCVEWEIFPRGETTVETDPQVIRSVMCILLENALFWLENIKILRTIRIHVDSTGFTFENNGPVIPEQYRQLIFEPRFTTRKEATGMGLTLARDLLAAIGARIERVEDREWTAFRISLLHP